MGLEAVLEPALDARRRGAGAVIALVVANRSPGGPPPGSRLFVPEVGEPGGSLHPGLDRAVLLRARRSLAEKRSRMRSFRLTDAGGEDVGVEGGEVDVFFEVLHRPPRLVVVGAGHIAVPLVSIARLLDFEVIVLDDRPEYATRQRFPEADQLLVGPYRET
ncbi:MAG: XdhC family protein, partial [Chloroflexi bacterium]|nr:XdhC family protein [Chloroflexota bacterium]